MFVTTSCGVDSESTPARLRVSAIPDQSPSGIHYQHDLLVEYLCRAVSVSCEWVDVKSYDEVVDRFGRGEIDLAYFGGVTFAIANHRYNAQPIAIRDIDARFSSVIVVPAASSARSLADLKNKPFLFGGRSSTSGHVMPRYFLSTQNIVPENFFLSVDYSRGHDDTLKRVANGEFAAGAANGAIAVRASKTGEIKGLRVLWETPPYIDYVWAARAELPNSLQQRLRNAFLELRPSNPEMRSVLEREQASGYLPVRTSEFNLMFSALRSQGILPVAQ